MRCILSLLVSVLVIGAGVALALPAPVASDLDRPVTAFDASSNETGDNESDDNVPGEGTDVPPVDVFGEEIPGLPVLFIIDRSCSMWGSSWTKMVEEYEEVLDSLSQANGSLKQMWADQNFYGPEPNVDIAAISYSTKAKVWNSSLVEATLDNISAAKGFLKSPSGMTNWTDALRKAATFGGVFRSVYFMSDGYPNQETWNQDAQADNLASQYSSFPGGMTFIAQYYSTGGTWGRGEMQDLAARMDGHTNVTGRFSDASAD